MGRRPKVAYEDRPGWKFYTARQGVNAMIDSLTRMSLGVCRDGKMRVTDTWLNSLFAEARGGLDRLAGELAMREDREVREVRKAKEEQE